MMQHFSSLFVLRALVFSKASTGASILFVTKVPVFPKISKSKGFIAPLLEQGMFQIETNQESSTLERIISKSQAKELSTQPWL